LTLSPTFIVSPRKPLGGSRLTGAKVTNRERSGQLLGGTDFGLVPQDCLLSACLYSRAQMATAIYASDTRGHE